MPIPDRSSVPGPGDGPALQVAFRLYDEPCRSDEGVAGRSSGTLQQTFQVATAEWAGIRGTLT